MTTPICVLIKRTYNGEDEPSDQYVLAGTNEQCVARVERMIRHNPKAKIRSLSPTRWHVSPPGGDDQGFFGPRALDLLIVDVPMAEPADG